MAVMMFETGAPGLTTITPGELFVNSDVGPECWLQTGPTWSDKYPGPARVRRPTMGLQLKGERHAYFQVFDEANKPIPLYNGVGGWNPPAVNSDGSSSDKKMTPKSNYYTDFMITSVQEQRAEKVQIVETFGQGYFYATGERPNVISVGGYLMNSKDFAWRAQFWENYNTYLRGTKLLERKAKAFFGWDDILVEGYIIGASASEGAEAQEHLNFGFTMLVVDHISLSALRFQLISEQVPREDIAAFSEITSRGALEVFTGHDFAATSRGMRSRQRLAAMGVIGTLLAKGSINMLAAAIEDPEGFASRVGGQALGKALDAGNDLIFEELGALIAPPLEGGLDCLPKSLTGAMLAREWWQDGRAWVTSLLDALAQVGVPVPGWIYQSLGNPLEFFKVFVAQNFFINDEEVGENAKVVALGVIGALSAAFGASHTIYKAHTQGNSVGYMGANSPATISFPGL